MFTIKSYIKDPNKDIWHYQKAGRNPYYYFIHIDDSEEILRIKKDLDLDYIEGVLYLAYNNEVIIDFTDYDLIDQLWAYFLNMMEDLLKNKKVEMYFPDTPIPMSIEDISNDWIMFSINTGKMVQLKLPKYEFLEVLLSGAKDFFEKMILLIEEEKDDCIFELRRIKKLEQQINALKENVYHF